MKRLKTSVARALEKRYLKKGDKILIECDVVDIMHSSLGLPLSVRLSGNKSNDFIYEHATIILLKPEPEPINFGAEGRILKHTDGTIVKTTGFLDMNYFHCYHLTNHKNKSKGQTEYYIADCNWQDITDTYKP